MKYNDEVEDTGDIGNLICFLLNYSKFKGMLWNFFEEILGEDSFEGLRETVQHWKEEQEEGKGEEELGELENNWL